ncbi:MAG: asparagine synthase (glutamine-hydrolyzing) [Candidatus Pseudothioglobus sp.]|jgi:asparagine synthase (glutamine-hydrolysing)
MCGIVGGLFNNAFDKFDQDFEGSLEAINHRGPDDSGYEVFKISEDNDLFLGHTRLAILDLSDAGHQPMTSQDGVMTIIFNGEIYNYKELRVELSEVGYNFTTETDTEVLLSAFHYWGVNCLSKLTGMFAFCVYNRKKNTLTLARDAFGIKPLFYTLKDDAFIFASEIKPVLKLLGEKPQPDLQAAYDYLVHGEYDSNERTFFESIKHLRPASYIEYDLEAFELSKPKVWWSPSIKESKGISFDEAVKQLRAKFLDSMRLHLRSDVPLGAALSGGVDSSALVCAMRFLEPDMPIHTFSYIAEGSKSEEKWVDIVNDRVDAIAHKVVATPEELMQDLDDLIKAQGEPFGTTSIYAQYRVFKLAKEQGITVTLDGQGADELLAGYIGYPGERLMSLLEVGSIFDMFRFAGKWSNYPGRSSKKAWMYLGRKILPDLFYRYARKLMGRDFEPEWINIERFKKAGVVTEENRMRATPSAKGRRVVEQLAYSLRHRGLPSLLRHGDRNSMRFSIESRVPFLTIDLAEYLYSLPESYLVNDAGNTKHVFREAMKGILPDEIIDRKDKIGFETDDKGWKQFYVDELSVSKFGSVNEIVDGQKFLRTSDADNEKICWRVMNYIKWHNVYFEPVCPEKEKVSSSLVSAID